MRIVISKKDEASLLLEGRRENAQAIIAKKIESPDCKINSLSIKSLAGDEITSLMPLTDYGLTMEVEVL